MDETTISNSSTTTPYAFAIYSEKEKDALFDSITKATDPIPKEYKRLLWKKASDMLAEGLAKARRVIAGENSKEDDRLITKMLKHRELTVIMIHPTDLGDENIRLIVPAVTIWNHARLSKCKKGFLRFKGGYRCLLSAVNSVVSDSLAQGIDNYMIQLKGENI